MTSRTDMHAPAQLGEVVRRLRHERRLTQEQLANVTGVSRRWIISIEKGECERAEIGLIMKLLDSLGVRLLIEQVESESGERQ